MKPLIYDLIKGNITDTKNSIEFDYSQANVILTMYGLYFIMFPEKDTTLFTLHTILDTYLMTKSSECDNFDYVIILPKEVKDLKCSFELEVPFGNTIGIQSASSSTRLGVYYYESMEDFQNALAMTIDQSKIESVENRAIDYVPDGDFEIVVLNGTVILIYEEEDNN